MGTHHDLDPYRQGTFADRVAEQSNEKMRIVKTLVTTGKERGKLWLSPPVTSNSVGLFRGIYSSACADKKKKKEKPVDC
jgi:hypothetical protein